MFFKVNFVFKLFLLIFLVKQTASQCKKCKIAINKNMNGYTDFSTWPLVLHPTYEKFHNVKAGIIELKENENLRLACSGVGNNLNLPNNPQIITIKCAQNENFLHGRDIRNFYDLSCRKVSGEKYLILSSYFLATN